MYGDDDGDGDSDSTNDNNGDDELLASAASRTVAIASWWDNSEMRQTHTEKKKVQTQHKAPATTSNQQNFSNERKNK